MRLQHGPHQRLAVRIYGAARWTCIFYIVHMTFSHLYFAKQNFSNVHESARVLD